jgi:hypothetical protein
MSAVRDPVSELLDRGARDLLSRVYAAAAGEWVMTRLADPPPETVAWAGTLGIELPGRDNAPTLSGRRMQVYTRWGRAFTRALYYQHKWYGAAGAIRAQRRMEPFGRALDVEFGVRRPKLGVIPAGRAVRIRLRPGGAPALRAVRRLGDGDRTFADDGEPAGRWSDPARRDWNALG